MVDSMFPIGLFLLIAWGIGIFGYSAGSLIIVLVIIVVIAIILRFFQGRRFL